MYQFHVGCGILSDNVTGSVEWYVADSDMTILARFENEDDAQACCDEMNEQAEQAEQFEEDD